MIRIRPRKLRRILTMKLPNAILILAVVLCVWIMSYFKPKSWTTNSEILFFDNIGLSNGALVLQWESSVAKVASPPVSAANVRFLGGPDPPPIDMAVFRLDRDAMLRYPDRPMVTDYEELIENNLRISMLPLVLLSAAWLTVPIVLVIRRRWDHQVRLQRGLCLKCGYDLRGNESGACPECGAEIELGAPNKME